jgi:hypothetical protein
MEAARERARIVYEESLNALSRLGRPTPLLHSIVRLILERRA